jgi:hypothetical protein
MGRSSQGILDGIENISTCHSEKRGKIADDVIDG